MQSFIVAIALLLQSPPESPPFDFDQATANQLRGKWSRADIDKDGVLRGIIQREHWVCGWVFVEDVYPFGEGAKPYRRVNTVWSLKRNK